MKFSCKYLCLLPPTLYIPNDIEKAGITYRSTDVGKLLINFCLFPGTVFTMYNHDPIRVGTILPFYPAWSIYRPVNPPWIINQGRVGRCLEKSPSPCDVQGDNVLLTL